jgi:hypothetical protein
MRVYHLLSSQDALSDLALRRIRISRYGDLNDPFELLAANLGDPQLRRAIGEFKKDFHKTKGLLCFSKKWESPVLWSHYASKHRGICLGFDVKDEFALEISYSDQRVPIEFLDDDPAKGLRDEFVRRLILTKYEHWRYEDEVRMIVALDEGTVEDGSYFLPFSENLVLREVILGPLCALPVDGMRAFVASMYGAEVRVRKAALAYKWYSVVPDGKYEAPNS